MGDDAGRRQPGTEAVQLGGGAVTELAQRQQEDRQPAAGDRPQLGLLSAVRGPRRPRTAHPPPDETAGGHGDSGGGGTQTVERGPVLDVLDRNGRLLQTRRHDHPPVAAQAAVQVISAEGGHVRADGGPVDAGRCQVTLRSAQQPLRALLDRRWNTTLLELHRRAFLPDLHQVLAVFVLSEAQVQTWEVELALPVRAIKLFNHLNAETHLPAVSRVFRRHLGHLEVPGAGTNAVHPKRSGRLIAAVGARAIIPGVVHGHGPVVLQWSEADVRPEAGGALVAATRRHPPPVLILTHQQIEPRPAAVTVGLCRGQLQLLAAALSAQQLQVQSAGLTAATSSSSSSRSSSCRSCRDPAGGDPSSNTMTPLTGDRWGCWVTAG